MVLPHSLAALLAAAFLSACATIACQPMALVVAEKQERTRLDPGPREVRTDHRGQVVESRRERLVTEHWVRDKDGHWHRLAEAEWRGAEVGKRLELCR